MKANLINASIALTTGLVCTSFAQAQSATPSWYLGGGVISAVYQQDENSNNRLHDKEVGIGYIRLGHRINDYFAIEGRVGTGLEDDSDLDILKDSAGAETESDVELSIESMAGFYVIGGIPTNTALYPYAMIGTTYIDVDAKADTGQTSAESGSTISYGAGVEIAITPGLSFNVEYTQYTDDYDDDEEKGAKLSGGSLGLTFRF
jgi:opacity protein-like surface antigen